MIRSLKALFDRCVDDFAEEPGSVHSLELAAAALLMEIGRADDEISGIERSTIRESLSRVFKLSEDELNEIVNAAEQAVEQAVSLYDFTGIVNERFDRRQKITLIEMLWQVAYADSVLDRYEEYYVRKISDLLHISHSDYIRTKLKVVGQQ